MSSGSGQGGIPVSQEIQFRVYVTWCKQVIDGRALKLLPPGPRHAAPQGDALREIPWLRLQLKTWAEKMGCACHVQACCQVTL